MAKEERPPPADPSTIDEFFTWIQAARELLADRQSEPIGKSRIRTGDYRLQFHVEGEEVVIERVGHRDGFYG